jgi:hypothetical protein
MDFIDRHALIAAMNARALDKAKPPGRVLLDQMVLGDEHALLEALVAQHLQTHANDPERSLATLGVVGSVGEPLKEIIDPDVQATLPTITPGSAESLLVGAISSGFPASASSACGCSGC